MDLLLSAETLRRCVSRDWWRTGFWHDFEGQDICLQRLGGVEAPEDEGALDGVGAEEEGW